MPRFFIDRSDISEKSISVTGENYKHLTKVLRAKIGDEITLCDKEGFDYRCIISSVDKEKAVADITDIFKATAEPEIKITLFQGLPKGDKLSFITEKSVEAGVFEIVPVSMQRSVMRVTSRDFEKKRDRLLKISESAAKQSGRGIIPDVRPLLSFDEAIKELAGYDFVVFPYENAKDKALKSILREKDFNNVAVIIGPEGGFSDNEVAALCKLGIVPVSLGKRILRTETAGIATIFNILYEKE